MYTYNLEYIKLIRIRVCEISIVMHCKLLIPIGLNVIRFKTNGLKMIVENKLQSFKILRGWIEAGELSKTLINV